MGGDTLDSRRALFVVSGTQGAGKTTVAALLAARFARGVHISGDALQKMIVSGRVWPDPGQRNINDDAEGEAAVQLRLRLRNACLLARSFYDAGFTPIVDDIVVGRRLAELWRELADIPFLFIMLAPDVETVRDRERERGSQLWREWEWLTLSIAETTPRVGLWLDTSRQAPGETVDEIMARAWDEALVPTAAAPVTARAAR